MHKRFARLITATVAAGTVAAGMTFGGTGSAAAQSEVVPLDRCWGISPNIVDQPFSFARLFVDQHGGGEVTAAIQDVSSLWGLAMPVGYESVGRLDWHNTDDDTEGTVHDTAEIRWNVGGPTFDFDPGEGTVNVTVSAVNRNALWEIPSTACSGTIEVR